MHRSLAHFARGVFIVGAASFLTPSALLPAVADDTSGVEPGVARISAVVGTVGVHRADVDGDYAAAPNAPVALGDYVDTQDGRAEIEFDRAMVLRVAPQTQVRLTQLSPDAHAVQLAQGTIEMRLFHTADGRPVVETPSADVRPDEAGRYRVTVDDTGRTFVNVRSGHVDVAMQDGSPVRTLGPGHGIAFGGSNDSANGADRSVASDAFDGWCDGRDAAWERVTNYTFVDAGMVGANDLYDYGQWIDDPQYGNVWTPSDVPPNWSPYSNGRYVWEAGYGWTWIGYEPWGYAPFHYGRWFYGPAGWCWTPGGYGGGWGGGSYFAYEPAVVGFFSFGGFGPGVTIGQIGWVPLAPGEVYYPWWRGGYGGWSGGAYANLGYAGTYYRNAPYGAVSIDGTNFAKGNFTQTRRFAGDGLARARAFAGVVPIVPTERNLAYGPHHVAPMRLAQSRFFKRMAAPHVAHVAFASQRATVAAVARKQSASLMPAFARNTPAWDRFEERRPDAVPPANDAAASARHPGPPAGEPARTPIAPNPVGPHPVPHAASAHPAPRRPVGSPKPAHVSADRNLR